jgi:hypothetical protein
MNQELREQAIEDWARADGWPVSRLRQRIIDRPDSPEAYAVEQRTLVLELQQRVKNLEKPDMFWDGDDPERSEDDPREILFERPNEVIAIWTATKGKTIYGFLTGDSDGDNEKEYYFDTKAEAEAALLATIDQEKA